MAEDIHDDRDRQSLIRAVRQELESLARAGLDRVPKAKARARVATAVARKAFRAACPDFGESRQFARRREFGPGRGSGAANARETFWQGFSDSFRRVAGGPACAPPTESLPVPSLSALFSSSTFDTPPVPGCERPALLSALAAEVAVCRRCPHLAETRTQTVFGVGNPETRLLFIGEAPGADEDRLGEPFVGRAGQLLTDMITKGMGLSREQVYIANILKCRPPRTATPTIDEANNCFPYLEKQIEIIRPEFICLLGKVAVQAILNTNQPMGKMRGKWHRYRGIPTLATYHPSYLLRQPSAKKDAWEDLQMLMKEMGLARPSTR